MILLIAQVGTAEAIATTDTICTVEQVVRIFALRRIINSIALIERRAVVTTLAIIGEGEVEGIFGVLDTITIHTILAIVRGVHRVTILEVRGVVRVVTANNGRVGNV